MEEMEDAGTEGSMCSDCPWQGAPRPGGWNVLVPLGHRLPLLSLRLCTTFQVKMLLFNMVGALYTQKNYPGLSKSLVSPASAGWESPILATICLSSSSPSLYLLSRMFPPRSYSSSSRGHSHLATLQERKYSKINLHISCLVYKDF